MRNRQKKGGKIMGVTTAVSMAKIAIDASKIALDSSKKALDIANQLKNVELKEAILDLKEELIRLREENILLKEKFMKQKLYDMSYDKNCYWNVKEDKTKEGPYCSVCWDRNKLPIRLTQSAVNRVFYTCGNCKNEYCIENIELY